MAKNSKDNGELFLIIGIILFLPFLLITLLSFNALKKQYLDDPSVRRVKDIKRLSPAFLTAAGMLVGACLIAYLGYNSWQNGSTIGLLVMLLALTAGLCGGYIMARHLAVLYMGVVLDSEKGEVYFPFDLQSYGVLDYISLRFLHDYCNVDSVSLASIKKISRGNRGKDLYLAGEFDARRITMSSKQKRDECLELIQSATDKRGIFMNEIEGY